MRRLHQYHRYCRRRVETFLSNDFNFTLKIVLFFHQQHCSHWGRVREQWRRAANVNEVRYTESTKILKSILVRP